MSTSMEQKIEGKEHFHGSDLEKIDQVREMPLDTVGHLAKGEALKVGTMDIDKLNVKRIKM